MKQNSISGRIGRISMAWIGLCAGAVLASDEPTNLPWKVNTPIVTVKKELYLKHPRPKAAALVSQNYVGPKLERLEYRGIEAVDDAPEESRFRFSNDNGRTWEP